MFCNSRRLFISNLNLVRLAHTGSSSSHKTRTTLVQKLSAYRWYHVFPTGLGVSIFLYWSWRIKERDKEEITIAKKWEITCYKAVPLRSLSRAFGWVSERPIPLSLRPHVFGAYSRAFGVNIEEMADPFDAYPCMSSFFCRSLKEGARPISHHQLVSPADGNVLNVGRLSSFRVEQVKGVTYSIEAFWGDRTWACGPTADGDDSGKTMTKTEKVKDVNNNLLPDSCVESWEDYKNRIVTNPKNDLYQCIVYLAPGDYHRFHSPVNWNVKFRRHFEGELFSVKPKFAKWIPDLFSLNERALYVGEWEHGFFSMTAVGATNVGSIRIYKDERLHTNERFRFKEGREWDLPIDFSWRKGEEVGEFRLGSTIVLIFEAPKNFDFGVAPGAQVRVGGALGTLRRDEKAQPR